MGCSTWLFSLSCCLDYDVQTSKKTQVPPPAQRRIPQHLQNQTAPYLQQAQYQKTQLRSQYPTEFQRREYGHTSPSPSRPGEPRPPSKSPTYQRHQKENDHQPPARPETRWPALNFDQQPEKISERSPSPWDDAVPQDSYPGSPETNFDPDLTPPPLYHRYPPKQEEQHTFPKPSAVSTPATGRRNVPSSYDISYYFRNSPNVVTPWRPPPSPPVPHYENSSAVEDWILAVGEETEREEQEYTEGEETEREEQGEQKEEETGHQNSRIVSGVSSLSYYSEAAPQHLRPVSEVSSVSSYYSEHRESRTLTPIPEAGPKLWGDAKYGKTRQEEYNWL